MRKTYRDTRRKRCKQTYIQTYALANKRRQTDKSVTPDIDKVTDRQTYICRHTHTNSDVGSPQYINTHKHANIPTETTT